MTHRNQKLAALLNLSHELGNPALRMAILGEGNTSARLTAHTFIVKASGSNLASLTKQGVVECKSANLISLLDAKNPTDAHVDAVLMNSRLHSAAPKPSVEALFHAWLLSLPNVEFIGHTHAAAVNSLMCSPQARQFAAKRIFPDQVVCCEVASVIVPYTDPGLRLAQRIRFETEKFIREHARPPRVILLQNHGIITLGPTPEAVLAAMLMTEKAAAIWLGAASLGSPTFLSPKQITRIADRPDEEIRRKALKI